MFISVALKCIESPVMLSDGGQLNLSSCQCNKSVIVVEHFYYLNYFFVILVIRSLRIQLRREHVRQVTCDQLHNGRKWSFLYVIQPQMTRIFDSLH